MASLFAGVFRSGFGGVFVLGAGVAGTVSRAEEPTVLEPIEVTTTRVEEMRRAGPAAVTAYDGAFLDANAIASPEALATITPGLFVSEQSPDGVSLNLRGITSGTSGPRVKPRVSVFQDGVGLNNAHGNGVAWFDVAEVAVFNGPQPTRFGEGVQSGALAWCRSAGRSRCRRGGATRYSSRRSIRIARRISSRTTTRRMAAF